MRVSQKCSHHKKRDTGSILIEQLQKYLGSECVIALVSEKPWASITFSGMRYMFAVAGNNPGKNSISQERLEKLTDHEFDFTGQFVADILIRAGDTTNASFKIEILVIADPVSE